jgi:pilus assembly protein CpaB
VSIRSLLVVLLALVFGASAAVGVNSLRGPQQAAAAAPVETVTVVLASADVPRFTTLSADALRTREYPKDLVPPGALTRPEDVAGRVTLTALVKDEPVLESKLAARGTGRGMAPGIPHGMRAYTIQTANMAAGVAGFILPGNKVDVLMTMTSGDSAITLLQGVEVLAVDQQVDAPMANKVDANQMRSVTLLVTPEQMTRLDLGQSKGTLHLSLRNTQDTDAVPQKRVTLGDIGLVPEPPPKEDVKSPEKLVVTPAAAPVESAAPARIRTVRGSQGGLVELD